METGLSKKYISENMFLFLSHSPESFLRLHENLTKRIKINRKKIKFSFDNAYGNSSVTNQ